MKSPISLIHKVLPLVSFTSLILISIFVSSSVQAAALPPELAPPADNPTFQIQLDAEDNCIMLMLNEAGNGMNLGKPPGSTFTAGTGLAIGNIPVADGLMAIDIYYGLPAYYRMEFDYYCPGSGDRDCDGTLRNDSTLSTDDHFVKAGDWEFVLIKRLSHEIGVNVNAEARDEGKVLFQTAKKYWAMYKQNGKCDGTTSSAQPLSEPQNNQEIYIDPSDDPNSFQGNTYVDPADDPNNFQPDPYIDPQDDPNNFQGEPYIDPLDDLDSSEACDHTVCINPACSPDGSQAWYDPVCIDGQCDYSNSPVDACLYGCEDGIGCLDENFEAWCTDYRTNNCPAYCDNGWLNVAIDCDEHMDCIYSSVFCENGCANGHCLSQPFSGDNNSIDTDDLLTLLAIGGGITVLGGSAIGGGFLGYKALKAAGLNKAALKPNNEKYWGYFDNAKKGFDYTSKTAGLLKKYKLAPEADKALKVAERLKDLFGNEKSYQEAVKRVKKLEKMGKALSAGGYAFDALDAYHNANKIIKDRGYTGWEKYGAYYVEGANKVFTTVLTKNPIVSAVDQVVGDLTGGVNIENTMRATEEGWHRATNYVSRKIYSVDKLDQAARSKTEASQYIKTLNRMRKQGKIDPAEARRLARKVYNKKLR